MLKNLNLKLFNGLAYLFYLKYANPLFIVVVCLSGQSINASDLPLVVHSKTTEWILTDTERNRIEYRHDVLAKSYIKRLGMWNEYQRDKKLYAELENQKPSNTGQVAAQKAALLSKYSEPTQDIIKNGTYDQLEDIVITFYDGNVDHVLKDKDEQQRFRQKIIPAVDVVSLLLNKFFGNRRINEQFFYLRKSPRLYGLSLKHMPFSEKSRTKPIADRVDDKLSGINQNLKLPSRTKSYALCENNLIALVKSRGKEREHISNDQIELYSINDQNNNFITKKPLAVLNITGSEWKRIEVISQNYFAAISDDKVLLIERTEGQSAIQINKQFPAYDAKVRDGALYFIDKDSIKTFCPTTSKNQKVLYQIIKSNHPNFEDFENAEIVDFEVDKSYMYVLIWIKIHGDTGDSELIIVDRKTDQTVLEKIIPDKSDSLSLENGGIYIKSDSAFIPQPKDLRMLYINEHTARYLGVDKALAVQWKSKERFLRSPIDCASGGMLLVLNSMLFESVQEVSAEGLSNQLDKNKKLAISDDKIFAKSNPTVVEPSMVLKKSLTPWLFSFRNPIKYRLDFSGEDQKLIDSELIDENQLKRSDDKTFAESNPKKSFTPWFFSLPTSIKYLLGFSGASAIGLGSWYLLTKFNPYAAECLAAVGERVDELRNIGYTQKS